jgi:hypothetical protein
MLGMWLGAALFFSAVVAPGAFAVLRSYQIINANEIAGAIVNRSLAAINVSGFVIGFVCLAAGLLKFRKVALKYFIVEVTSLSVLTLATAIGHWLIAANMRALRLTLTVPIDQIPAGDSRRIRFDTLHAYSVKALGVAMIAAIAGFVMVARMRRNAK